MPQVSVTDWIMVGITAVYVIATIFISVANIRSAKATREQLAESKRQYDDKRSLEVMPYIQVESIDERLFDYRLSLDLEKGALFFTECIVGISIKNVGLGAAKAITFTYFCNKCLQVNDNVPFLFQALIPGENKTVKLTFRCPPDRTKDMTTKLVLHYSDLLENKYDQSIEFFLPKARNTMELKLLPPKRVLIADN